MFQVSKFSLKENKVFTRQFLKSKSVVMITKTCISLLFCIVCLSATTMSQPADNGETGRYCKKYNGGEGVIVTIMRIGDDKSNEALVAIEGVDHSWDRKIFKAKVNSYDNKKDFTISVKGKSFTALTWRDGRYILMLPKENAIEQMEFYLAYSKDLSGECKPEWLLKEYKEQKTE